MEHISANEIKSYVVEAVTDIIRTLHTDTAVNTVRKGLAGIVKKYTTMEYSFNLAMEHFVGLTPTDCYDILKVILEEDIEKANERVDDHDELDVAFAAYYGLSLIYKKQNAIGELSKLLGEKYNALNGYPLKLEVKARYFKRNGEYMKALEADELAIHILRSKNIVNPAVGISYASTVCNILENSRARLNGRTVAAAREHITAAIELNPKYPKYYFLEAKLLFYSRPENASEEELLALEEQVQGIITRAEVALYELHGGLGKFYETEMAEYADFRSRVRDAIERQNVPMFPVEDETLDELKQRILSFENHALCSASAELPPLPDLGNGDKYFFVCYSSRDFRSVYCDLIELYKKKIPFRYDAQLTSGEDWKEQVDLYVSDSDCVGVVFYLSKNILSTDSVCEEIDIVQKYGKRYFAVNLDDRLKPSEMLIQLILENCTLEPPHYAYSGDTMRKFLSFFEDSKVHIKKPKGNTDAGTTHMAAYKKALRQKFPTLNIED